MAVDCSNPCTTSLPSFLEGLVFPALVGVGTYLLTDRLGEWRRRKSYSRLGVAIVDTLIEEVNLGCLILKASLDYSVSPSGNPPVNAPPRQSWSGMNTVPDDVLLRIIEASEGYEAKGFHPRDIRIHCKNYFEHILPNWDNVVAKFRAGQEWMQDATTLLRDHKLLEAAEGVLLMLKNTKTVLERNSKRIIPK